MADKPHLVWIGHIGSHTGLARVTDNLLPYLAEDWRITVIAISRPSDDYQSPYAKVLGALAFQDWMGRIVLAEVLAEDPPDRILAFMDPWVLAEFLKGVAPSVPLVGYLPVDGHNLKDVAALERLEHAIFLSPFALKEARQAGYAGPASVVGHGVDLTCYKPGDKAQAREALGLPPSGFLIGNVGRNQPRKRWDLTLMAFQRLLAMLHRGDALPWLYCHTSPHESLGWDLPQLAAYLGIEDRILFPTFANPHNGYDEGLMPLVYAALDLQVTSAWGEGFGLTTLEGMACGVPQIAPRHTALADWAARGAYMLSAGEQIITTGGQNLAGFVTSPAQLAHTMWTLLRDASLRQQVARAGFSLAHEPQFRWYACAEGIHAVLAAGVRDGVTA